MFETQVDHTLVPMGPEEAFFWIFDQFKQHQHNHLTWMDAKNTIATANAIVARWEAEKAPSVEVIEPPINIPDEILLHPPIQSEGPFG